VGKLIWWITLRGERIACSSKRVNEAQVTTCECVEPIQEIFPRSVVSEVGRPPSLPTLQRRQDNLIGRPRGAVRRTGLLRNIALIKVLNGGVDYEFRIAGDAVVCAYGVALQNRGLSDFETTAPRLIRTVRSLYDHVGNSGMPLAVRCRTGHASSRGEVYRRCNGCIASRGARRCGRPLASVQQLLVGRRSVLARMQISTPLVALWAQSDHHVGLRGLARTARARKRVLGGINADVHKKRTDGIGQQMGLAAKYIGVSRSAVQR
jgi:hypothetical protein